MYICIYIYEYGYAYACILIYINIIHICRHKCAPLYPQLSYRYVSPSNSICNFGRTVSVDCAYFMETPAQTQTHRHTDAQTHWHAHARAHTHTHAQVKPMSCICTCILHIYTRTVGLEVSGAQKCTCIHIFTHQNIRTFVHTHMYIDTYTRKWTTFGLEISAHDTRSMDVHIYTYIHTQNCTHIRILHMYTNKWTHTFSGLKSLRMHIYIYTHTYVRVCTYIYIYVHFRAWSLCTFSGLRFL